MTTTTLAMKPVDIFLVVLTLVTSCCLYFIHVPPEFWPSVFQGSHADNSNGAAATAAPEPEPEPSGHLKEDWIRSRVIYVFDVTEQVSYTMMNCQPDLSPE